MCLSFCSMTGCRSNMILRVTATDDSDIPTPTKVRRIIYWWGQKQPFDIRTPEHCPSICKVQTTTNFGDIFISFVTLGIAVPQTLEYFCCPDDPAPSE